MYCLEWQSNEKSKGAEPFIYNGNGKNSRPLWSVPMIKETWTSLPPDFWYVMRNSLLLKTAKKERSATYSQKHPDM